MIPPPGCWAGAIRRASVPRVFGGFASVRERRRPSDREQPHVASRVDQDAEASDVAVRRVQRIAFVYLLVAAAWIMGSGLVADVIADRTDVSLITLEVLKGLGFVAVTGTVLHRSLHRWSNRLERATRAEREAASQLRHVEHMRRAFLAGVSHELRTPLTAIVGFGELIHRDAGKLADDRITELAGRLVVNAERLQALIVDLLEVDRLLQGIGELHAEPTDVTRLVRRIVSEMDHQGGAINVVGESIVARVDGPKVERLLQHALHNTQRHSGGATLVTVRVDGDAEAVRLRVEDNGVGFPEELLGELFDPFVQSDDAVLRPSPGLGIGLTLIAQFATLHGGAATVENIDGGGARLTVTFPRRFDALLPGLRAGPATDGPGSAADRMSQATYPAGSAADRMDRSADRHRSSGGWREDA